MHGVLITTGDQEKFCVPEAYNLLNEVRTYAFTIPRTFSITGSPALSLCVLSLSVLKPGRVQKC